MRLTVDRQGGTVTLEFAERNHRLRVGLVMEPFDRSIDVSATPAFVDDDRGDDVAAKVDCFCRDHGLWTMAAFERDASRAITGAAFPLLGAAYDHRSATVAEVPRWATSTVAASSLRCAARAAFGARATRPVVRALGNALTPRSDDAELPRLHALALALMGAAVLAPDSIARVLDVAGAVPRPVRGWPSVDDVNGMRRIAPRLGAQRLERMLLDAARHDDGLTMLTGATSMLTTLPSGAGHRLPNRLPALHEWCLEHTAVDPVAGDPPPEPEPERAPARPPVAHVPAVAYRAPATSAAPPPRAAPVPRTTSLIAVDGRWVAPRRRLVVPRTAGEIVQWGARLQNCLGSFTTAVVEGRSVLIGVEVDDRLAYCLELQPATRVVRQFLGKRNRAVPPSDAAAVCRALVDAGLVDPAQPENEPWLALSR